MKAIKVIIDRFEGEFAVVETEDKEMLNIPHKLLPDACEGDVVTITIDKDETEKRKKNIKNLMNDLFE